MLMVRSERQCQTNQTTQSTGNTHNISWYNEDKIVNVVTLNTLGYVMYVSSNDVFYCNQKM